MDNGGGEASAQHATGSAATAAAQPAGAPAAAGTTLTAAEREDAWRLVAAAVAYQGVFEQALRAHDQTIEACIEKIGKTSSYALQVERCSPMFLRTLKRLKAQLPVPRSEDGCLAQHRRHAEELLSFVIAKAAWASRDPKDGMGYKTLYKRDHENPPKACPALAHFRCETSRGDGPCAWHDLAILWTDDPLTSEPARAIRLTDGTPVTRKAAQQKLDQYFEQTPAPGAISAAGR